MPDLAVRLQSAPVFRHLPSGDLHRLAALGQRRSLAEGEVLAAAGDLWRHVTLIDEGILRVVKSAPDDRTLALRTFRPGEIFWAHTSFCCVPLAGTLIAAMPGRCTLWPHDEVLPLIRRHPECLWDLVVEVSSYTVMAADQIGLLAFQPLAARMARLLLEQFDGAEEGRLLRDLTLDDMAARIGTTREHASRLLRRFVEVGLIDLTRSEIAFRDREGLVRLAQGEG